MTDHPWPWDDDEMQAATVSARRRTRWVLAAATIVLAYVLVRGILLYHRLPDYLPWKVEGQSLATMRPVTYVPRNPVTAFFPWLFGIVFMVMACKVEAGRDYSWWPGWGKTQILTAARRKYLLLPI
jgi:uncharacterized membrane protein